MSLSVDKSPLVDVSVKGERLNFIKSIYIKSCISKIIQRPFFDDNATHIKEYKYICSYFEFLAKRAFLDSNPSLEDYIQDITTYIELENNISLKSIDINRRINEIRLQSRMISCGRCSLSNTNKCCIDGGGQGECISEITDIFKFLQQKCMEIISWQDGDLSVVENLSLSIEKRESDNRVGILSKFSISASTEANSAVIRLRIKEDALNREGLLQLIYVLGHEVLIHGIQGIYGHLERPFNVDDKCSWSEGFMDRVVFLQLSQWLNYDDVKLPPWLSEAREEAYFACHRMHESRLYSSTPYIKEHHIARRRMAIQACDELNKAFLGGNHRSTRLSERFLKFSYLLNTHWLDRELRETLTTKLSAFLNPNSEVTFNYNNIVKLCMMLEKNRDLERFIRDFGLQM